MSKCVVVGGGLFGSLAALQARSLGHEVTVIDNKEALAASPASGGVMKPSWLAGIDVNAALKHLERFTEVKSVPFAFMGTHVTAYAVNPVTVLVEPDVVDTVTHVSDGRVETSNGAVFKGHVLVAAGVWTRALLPSVVVEGLAGVGFVGRGTLKHGPFIKAWAPYKQIVAHQMDEDSFWVGDGSAIKAANWTLERCETSRERCAKAVGVRAASLTAKQGLRPKVPGQKYGVFDALGKRLHVATGGAKSGMAMAALMGAQWAEALP